MNEKSKTKLRELRLFDQKRVATQGNRVQPTNDFIEFKKADIGQSIGACFLERAGRYKDNLAVKVQDRSITYGFLKDYAARVARRVQQEYDDRYRLSEPEKTRYQRQLLLHGWGLGSQEKLKQAVVFAAGAGGSGSPLLLQLALLGIGTIIVCDHDNLELSNLNRQVLHDESRIGLNKALSAQMTLNRINPHVKVTAHPVKITRENVQELVGDADLIFDNVDDLEAKFVLSEYAVRKSIPHILSSMMDLNAYAVVFHSPYTPCFHCLYDRNILEKIEALKTYSADYKKSPNPVASPALFMSTGFVVNEAIKILLGFERPAYNKYILFNQRGADLIANTDGYRRLTYPFTPHFKQLSRDQGKDWDRGWEGSLVEELHLTPDPHCPVCGKNPGPGLLKSIDQEKKHPPVQPPQVTADGESHWQAAALLFDPGVEMVIGLMGTVMSGKTYVPLDPAYPRERLEYMLDDSEARVIVTDSRHYALAETLRHRVNKNIHLIDIDQVDPNVPAVPPEVTLDPDRVAYVLYTSGSTGKPKGVMQSHRNVLHFARVYTNALHIHPGDRLTLFSSYSFDAAKMDLFGALLNGAALYPFEIKAEGNLYRLPAWLQKEKITIYHSIPTVYRYFTGLLPAKTGKTNSPTIPFPQLRLVVLGGEAVNKNDLETYKKCFPDGCIFVNGLGPTESTVTLQYFMDKNTQLTQEAVPVGYPVEETRVFLLDEENRETVINAVGEIIYKSDYLALGYLKNLEKTDEVFVTDPLTGTGRVYRSGDLGRRLEDGSIQYVGRKDFQVKIMGYRVELAEIESILDRQEGIKKSVVICQPNQEGENFLIAYYQSLDGGAIDESNLVRRLKESLPDYMIPGAFFRLETFPLTGTGKIDRKVLSDKNLSRELEIHRVNYSAPQNEMEHRLEKLWSGTLGLETDPANPAPIGIDDNFFLWGGNSLKIVMLISKIKEQLKVRLTLADFFQALTIRELAKNLMRTLGTSGAAGRAASPPEPLTPVEEKEYYELSIHQQRLWYLQQLQQGGVSFNMNYRVELNQAIEVEALKQALEKLVKRHESLRTTIKEIHHQPYQWIAKTIDQIPFRFIDLTTGDEAGAQEKAEALYREAAETGFDLAQGPLYRTILVKLAETRSQFIFILHHIISDGWSMEILRREIPGIYREITTSQSWEPGPLTIQYKDFARWHNRRVARDQIREEAQRYWKEKLPGFPRVHLPGPMLNSNPGETGQARKGVGYLALLDRTAAKKIRDLANDRQITPFAVMFAAYIFWLYRFSHQEEIGCSIIQAGREHEALGNVVGFFVNSVPFRIQVQPKEPFKRFLHRVHTGILEAIQNQAYPPELACENLGLRYPDINVSFNLLNLSDPGDDNTSGPIGTPHVEDAGEVKFDIEPYIREFKESIQVYWVYRKVLFEPAAFEFMAQEYVKLVDFFTTSTNLEKSYQDYKKPEHQRVFKRN